MSNYSKSEQEKAGELVSLKIDIAFNECKAKIYEAFVVALDKIQEDLNKLKQETTEE